MYTNNRTTVELKKAITNLWKIKTDFSSKGRSLAQLYIVMMDYRSEVSVFLRCKGQ